MTLFWNVPSNHFFSYLWKKIREENNNPPEFNLRSPIGLEVFYSINWLPLQDTPVLIYSNNGICFVFHVMMPN